MLLCLLTLVRVTENKNYFLGKCKKKSRHFERC